MKIKLYIYFNDLNFCMAINTLASKRSPTSIPGGVFLKSTCGLSKFRLFWEIKRF